MASQIELDATIPKSDWKGPWYFIENAFCRGKGVSKNNCLPLSVVQLARQDTRGDKDISESHLVCSGLWTTWLVLLFMYLSSRSCSNSLADSTERAFVNLGTHGCRFKHKRNMELRRFSEMNAKDLKSSNLRQKNFRINLQRSMHLWQEICKSFNFLHPILTCEFECFHNKFINLQFSLIIKTRY